MSVPLRHSVSSSASIVLDVPPQGSSAVNPTPANPITASPVPPPRATPASSLDIYTGDPNCMTTLARGLIVI